MKFAGQAIKFEFISGQSGAIERSTVEEDMIRFGLKIKITLAALREDKLVGNEGENEA